MKSIIVLSDAEINEVTGGSNLAIFMGKQGYKRRREYYEVGAPRGVRFGGCGGAPQARNPTATYAYSPPTYNPIPSYG